MLRILFLSKLENQEHIYESHTCACMYRSVKILIIAELVFHCIFGVPASLDRKGLLLQAHGEAQDIDLEVGLRSTKVKGNVQS